MRRVPFFQSGRNPAQKSFAMLDHSCQVQRHPLAERGFDDEFVGTAATKEEARNAIFTALDGPGGTK
jgi:hypothetical protein